MAALEFLSQPLWQRLTFTLVHFVWQGTLIALLLAVALSIARQANARYLLAMLALTAIIICPWATLAWSDHWLPAEVLLAPNNESHISGDLAATHVEINNESAQTSSLSWSDLSTALLAWVQPYLVLAWLAGVLALSIRLLMSYTWVRELRRRTAPLTSAATLTAARLKQTMGVSHHVRVSASIYVKEALVVGLWQPLVLVPTSWLTELEPRVIEAVLAHELAHIRRHDLWVNLLQRIVETLLFYHPGVWYVSRVLRVEREKCCDELAVAATGQKVVYVEALELVARKRLAASPSMWVTAMGGGKKMNLLERVQNVLGLSSATSTARYWPVGVAALVVPAGLWCATLAYVPTAQAQEDKKEGDRPVERREGDRERPRPEPDRPRADGERRDGDRPAPDRPAPDRPAPERREGDRPVGPPRDGDRPAPRGEGGRDRPVPPPAREGDWSPDRNPPPRGDLGPVSPELMRLIGQLREEVQQLRREVRELREGRGPVGPGREGERRPEGPRADGPRPDGPRPDGPRREGELREAPRREGPPREGDRPRGEGERRPDAPRREGERRPDGPPREGERRPDAAPRLEERRREGAPREEKRPDAEPKRGEGEKDKTI